LTHTSVKGLEFKRKEFNLVQQPQKEKSELMLSVAFCCKLTISHTSFDIHLFKLKPHICSSVLSVDDKILVASGNRRKALESYYTDKYDRFSFHFEDEFNMEF